MKEDSVSFNPYNKTVTTTVDVNQFSMATEQSCARTMLHESMCAWLSAYFVNDPYAYSLTYPEMVEYWNDTQDWEVTQHQYFAGSIVNEISVALGQYAQSRGYDMTQFSPYHFEDLAWGGLEGTSQFQSKNISDRNRIKDVVLIEATGKDRFGIGRTQLGNHAGCN